MGASRLRQVGCSALRYAHCRKRQLRGYIPLRKFCDSYEKFCIKNSRTDLSPHSCGAFFFQKFSLFLLALTTLPSAVKWCKFLKEADAPEKQERFCLLRCKCKYCLNGILFTIYCYNTSDMVNTES